MKVLEFLSKKAIKVNLTATTKDDTLEELVDLLISSGDIAKKDRVQLIEALKAREALGSTAIGHNVGIPHAKIDCVKRLVAALGISQKGVDFDSLDGEPVYMFFLLVAPQDSAGPHLKALASISRLTKDKFFRDSLRQAKDEKAVLKIISQEDDKI
jgi:mannitol/fructose-specific phosphotransferase system IIA component (Ntr-type)